MYNDLTEGTAPSFSVKTGAKSALKGEAVRNFKKAKYAATLADDMTSFFESYDQSFGAPSFEKFARAKGITLADLNGFRRHRQFERAYRECGEIRRDYLIDNALTKRFDPTFVRHLLSLEFEEHEAEASASFVLRVVE